MKFLKIGFVLSFISLVIGASFHDFRMHPENVDNYNLGVNMGVSMISIFVIFLLLGIVLVVIYKKKSKNK
ncbi:MAG: hypothetical protein WCR97_00855 [Bacilli bacterium]